MLLLLGLLVVFGLCAHARADNATEPPSAEPSDRARALFLSGTDKTKAEQWDAAEQDFRTSYALVPRPSTLYNLALVLYRQRRFQESSELCNQLVADSDSAADAPHAAPAQALLHRIREQGASVEVLITPEGAAWKVDGRHLAGGTAQRQALLAPGPHVLEFSAHGYERRRVDLVLTEGARHTLTVELSAVPASAAPPPPAAPPPVRLDVQPARPSPAPDTSATASSNRMPQWLLLGTGGALLAASAVTGILALNADAEFEQECPELRNCDPALTALQERTATLSTATDVLLVTGGLVAGGALVWLLLTGDPTLNNAAAMSAHGLTLRASF